MTIKTLMHAKPSMSSLLSTDCRPYFGADCADELYAPVPGTSETSRYFLMGSFVNGCVKVAYRYRKNTGDVSIRVEIDDQSLSDLHGSEAAKVLRDHLIICGYCKKDTGHLSIHGNGVSRPSAVQLLGGTLLLVAEVVGEPDFDLPYHAGSIFVA